MRRLFFPHILTNASFKDEVTILPGSFGLTGVKLSRLFPCAPNGRHVLLLHGVHSSANLSPRNKFRHLAILLAQRGMTPWLCETSRKVANHDAYIDDIPRWIEDAFRGKNFQNEFDDCAAALEHVLQARPASLWIWGSPLAGSPRSRLPAALLRPCPTR
ncbi:MAG: hypothetical protein RR340_09430 [Cloacibacillus sp.]